MANAGGSAALGLDCQIDHYRLACEGMACIEFSAQCLHRLVDVCPTKALQRDGALWAGFRDVLRPGFGRFGLHQWLCATGLSEKRESKEGVEHVIHIDRDIFRQLTFQTLS